jgi:hypothetical protein
MSDWKLNIYFMQPPYGCFIYILWKGKRQQKKFHYFDWPENLKGGDNLENLGIGQKMMLDVT